MIARLLAGCLLAVVGLLALAVPAAADDLVVRRVDTTEMPTVRLTVQVVGRQPPLRSFNVREDGRLVERLRVVPLAESTAAAAGVVLVVDASGSMAAGGKLDAAKRAALAFIAAKAPRTQVALVAFADVPRVVAGFTSDAAALTAAVEGLTAAGETALWDAVVSAVSLFRDHPALVPSVVVLSDGADTASVATDASAVAAATTAEARTYAVGLAGDGVPSAPLVRLAQVTGGTFTSVSRPDRLTATYEGLQVTIASQYELTWETGVRDGTLDLQVAAEGLVARASAAVGARTEGAAASPRAVGLPADARFFDSPLGLAVLGALLAVAVAAGLLALAAVAGRTRPDLDRALLPYLGGETAPERDTGARSFADVAIVRRAVAATASLANQRGLLDRLEERLDQADLRLRPAEALFFSAAFAILLSIAALLLDPFLGLVVLVLAALTPIALVRRAADRRRKAFVTLLPDTLHLLSSSMRAGYSLPQAVATVAAEVEDPMGRELGRAVAEVQLGRPLDEALDDVSKRMGSPDFDWVVIAIRMQREVGGNLAELLTTVAETMVARDRLRRDVQSLTAEGRLSAGILVVLPFAIGAFMWVRNPGYLDVLFRDTTGKAIVVAALGLLLAGVAWIRKIVEIEV